MRREQAWTEAAKIARRDGIRMVVTVNPYGEEADEADRHSYFPAAAVSIFRHETVVDTIDPPAEQAIETIVLEALEDRPLSHSEIAREVYDRRAASGLAFAHLGAAIRAALNALVAAGTIETETVLLTRETLGLGGGETLYRRTDEGRRK